jgi:hypothetical protein
VPYEGTQTLFYTFFFVLFRVRRIELVFSNKPKAALLLVVLFAFLVIGAQAAEQPAKSVMPLGSLGLASSQAALANNSSIGNSSVTNISINNTTMNNSSISKVPVKSLSMNDKMMNTSTPAVPVVDLSGYAKDRKDKNLTGYRNIMYPMGESRGPPAVAAGGGRGGGGGCGCGGG